jgi:predicted DNA-binding transcriptional regulator AlpA
MPDRQAEKIAEMITRRYRTITLLKKDDAMKTNGKPARKRKSPMKKEISPILPPEGFVRIPVVLAVLGVGKTSFLAGVREGKYPKPVKLAPRISAWRVEDIRAVIARFANK